MGFIWRLLHIEGNKYTSWAELEVVRPSHSKCNGFISLQHGPCIYIPLGWHRWTVTRQIFLMPHPMKAATHIIFNHHFKWVITDLWPSEICQEQDNHSEEEGSDHGEEEGSNHSEEEGSDHGEEEGSNHGDN